MCVCDRTSELASKHVYCLLVQLKQCMFRSLFIITFIIIIIIVIITTIITIILNLFLPVSF